MKKVCFVLSFLLLNSFLCSAAKELNPVLDANGEEVKEGQQYYILPFIWGPGGGLTLGSPVNATETCPRTVVQDPFEVNTGEPLTFTPVNSQNGVIRVFTDLNIKFNAITICNESNVWKVEYDEEIRKYIVVTNGVAGNPGAETLTNWFRFEPIIYGPVITYKLAICPSVCDVCLRHCSDLGIFIDQDGTRRLALTIDPLRFLLFKA